MGWDTQQPNNEPEPAFNPWRPNYHLQGWNQRAEAYEAFVAERVKKHRRKPRK
jgi:hypothetical protein